MGARMFRAGTLRLLSLGGRPYRAALPIQSQRQIPLSLHLGFSLGGAGKPSLSRSARIAGSAARSSSTLPVLNCQWR